MHDKDKIITNIYGTFSPKMNVTVTYTELIMVI